MIRHFIIYLYSIVYYNNIYQFFTVYKNRISNKRQLKQKISNSKKFYF